MDVCGSYRCTEPDLLGLLGVLGIFTSPSPVLCSAEDAASFSLTSFASADSADSAEED